MGEHAAHGLRGALYWQTREPFVLHRMRAPGGRCAGVRSASAKRGQEGPSRANEAALKATPNTWAIATLLASRTARVVVSNPAKTRAIAEAKGKRRQGRRGGPGAHCWRRTTCPAVWRTSRRRWAARAFGPATAIARGPRNGRAHRRRTRVRWDCRPGPRWRDALLPPPTFCPGSYLSSSARLRTSRPTAPSVEPATGCGPTWLGNRAACTLASPGGLGPVRGRT